MNKINYFLVPIIIVLLISNIFLYSNLSKQNSEIKQEISKLEQKQTNQQASQKEAMQNLQNLITFNWKTYQNDKFGFSFKYPDYVNICDITEKFKDVEKTDLNLIIIPRNCGAMTLSEPQIIIKKNNTNYKTTEEAFYKEFPQTVKSLNPQLDYFKIAGIDAYGGINKDKNNIGTANNPELSYEAIILKNDYIIKFRVFDYNVTIENRQIGNKPISDAIISNLFFY